MTTMPAETFYQRWLGWHAPLLRRAAAVTGLGVFVALVLLRLMSWGLALVVGWDAAALTFLLSVWPIVIAADGRQVEQLAGREDETRASAAVLLIGASVASLVGVALALDLAGRETGWQRQALIGLAVLTVTLSWTVINTVYTLRYAHLYVRSGAMGILFGDSESPQRPDYRDFAYVAFTIGMTYQVSDTTLRDPHVRRVVLSQALVSYVFGVVIVAGSVNLIAALLG
jgi:uncharacterized membrane protein